MCIRDSLRTWLLRDARSRFNIRALAIENRLYQPHGTGAQKPLSLRLAFADAPPNVVMSTMASAAPLDPGAVDRVAMNQQAEAFERLRDSIGG